MAIGLDFFCRWDTTLNANVPSGAVPTTITNIEVTTDQQKYGVGSIHAKASTGGGTVSWGGVFSADSYDEGELSFWYYQGTNQGFKGIIIWAPSGGNSTIQVTVQQIAAINYPTILLIMKDNAGNTIINTSFVSAPLAVQDKWYKVRIAWIWNVLGELTSVYLTPDGGSESLVGSSSAGETNSRALSLAAITTTVTIDTLSSPRTLNYVDHFMFGLLSDSILTLGSPLSLPNMLGR